MHPPNLIIVQGGGPTAVFNASLAALLRELAQQPGQAGTVLGARFGVRGLVTGDVVDLSGVTDAELLRLERTPGAALGSSRHSPDEAENDQMLRTLERLGVGAMVFLGGDGTMRGARLVSERCRARGLTMQVVGVPKTVDNDLAGTDRSPGYASAARYAAGVARELAADLRSLPQPVSILETLGRNVGWIAAATALARLGDADGPHVVCLPEVPFDEDQFLGYVDDAVRHHGWAEVVVAEGILHADGSLVFQITVPGQADALQRPMCGGVSRFLAGCVAERLGMRCRAEAPGLLGRGAMPYVAARDLQDARAVGQAAARALRDGISDVMVSLKPVEADEPTRTTTVPLGIGGGERAIPPEWLCKGPVPVGDRFLQYASRLVGPLEEHTTVFGTRVGRMQ